MTREEAICIIGKEIQIDVRFCTQADVNRYIEALKMAIAALREQHRWIPVTERLPKMYKTVLAYRENLSAEGGYTTLEYIVPNFGEPTQWKNDLNTWKSKVTHWMPLPEPPEVEE